MGVQRRGWGPPCLTPGVPLSSHPVSGPGPALCPLRSQLPSSLLPPELNGPLVPGHTLPSGSLWDRPKPQTALKGQRRHGSRGSVCPGPTPDTWEEQRGTAGTRGPQPGVGRGGAVCGRFGLHCASGPLLHFRCASVSPVGGNLVLSSRRTRCAVKTARRLWNVDWRPGRSPGAAFIECRLHTRLC